MSSIDAVTASFATSLALAGSDVIDISHLNDAGNQRTSQAYLLANPLTKKPFGTPDLQCHFRRVWVLDGGFRVQDRTHNGFVFTFDLKRVRNKVLRGGPWYFNRAPVLLQEYDGLEDPLTIPMKTLFFWVRISGIPPALEEKGIIMKVASLAGKFLAIDQKLFDNTGKIRVHVAHDISLPFHLKKTLKIISGVVKEITYVFENLVGKCNDCNLIIHEQGSCPKTAAQGLVKQVTVEEPTRLALASQFPGFTNLRFQNGAFRFQGLQAHILPPIARNLFGTPTPHKLRKPIVIRNEDIRPADNALALVPVTAEQQTSKRDRSATSYTSPKKLKVFFKEGENATSPSMLQKWLKVPEFHTKFSAQSLGLIEAPGGVLIPKESISLKEDSLPVKKKKGRPLGSKNKNPSKNKKVYAEEVLSMICPSKPPSPSVKGKGKI